MKVSIESVTNHLSKHGIRPSMQRIAIMQFLMENLIHPTADEIYNRLIEYIPTLSRTTVYNTLWLLAEHDAITIIDADRTNVHFDYIKVPHAHFYCCSCGVIHDIMVDDSSLKKEIDNCGFHIQKTDIYYKGLCKKCFELTKSNNNLN